MPEFTRRHIIASGVGTVTAGSITGCLSGGSDNAASAGGNGEDEDSTEAGSGTGGDSPVATSSFFVFGDFAKKVADDTADAETLVPVGQHGHGWEPGPQIQGRILEGDILIHGSEGFQPWADDIVESLRSDDADVMFVSAAEGIELAEGGHEHGDEHSDESGQAESTPWEWAGLYHLDAGTYTYEFEQGPDPRMHLAVLATEEGGDHGIHHVEETAHSLYENGEDAHTSVEADGTLTPSSESLYTLQFVENGTTSYTLQVESAGHYVLFAQHVPSEFNAMLSNESGTSVSPELTETAGGHGHEDEHGHEGGGSHETEGEHEGESEEAGDGHDHGSGSTDPHFWLDPARAKEAVGNISDAFAEVDGENSEVYAENAERYRSRLDELDSEFESSLSDAPKDVVFVAGHDAFGYLAERYGFEVETLTGLSPDDRPTPRDIEAAQEIIEEHDLQYVCSDPLESQRAANQLVEETDATEVLPLTAIPGQTEQWEENGWGYVELMENMNLDTLRKALGAE